MRLNRALLAALATFNGAGLVCVAEAQATSIAAPPKPNATTVDGPATLSSPWTGPVTLEGSRRQVLVSWMVRVGQGSKAAKVRLRARENFSAKQVLGDWVELPAKPGIYVFPAPHIKWDYRDAVLAVDQQSGGLKIVHQSKCTPELGSSGDTCQSVALSNWAPALADSAPWTNPTSSKPGAALTVQGIAEGDRDGDLAGDQTEDQTDLKISVKRGKVKNRRLRLAITVKNRGPRAADIPEIYVHGKKLRATWSKRACLRSGSAASRFRGDLIDGCILRPIANGKSTKLTLTLKRATGARFGKAYVSVNAEGPDPRTTNNSFSVVAGR